MHICPAERPQKSQGATIKTLPKWKTASTATSQTARTLLEFILETIQESYCTYKVESKVHKTQFWMKLWMERNSKALKSPSLSFYLW